MRSIKTPPGLAAKGAGVESDIHEYSRSFFHPTIWFRSKFPYAKLLGNQNQEIVECPMCNSFTLTLIIEDGSSRCSTCELRTKNPLEMSKLLTHLKWEGMYAHY